MKFINLIFISNRTGVGLALILFIAYAAHIVATPFVVTTTVDNGNNVTPTAGSLRAAINGSNLVTGPNTISFSIPTSDPGYNAINNTWTIQPPVDLPNISKPVTIDGYAGNPGGATPNTLAQGDNAVLTIVLNGNNYLTGNGTTTGQGLHFVAGSSGSVVRGLVINQWLGNGILVDAASANITGISIVGCFIGTDASGMVQLANRTGIGLSGLTNKCINTVIGTPALADRNIITGSFGPFVEDSYNIQGGGISSYFNSGTVIQNNYIGTDRNGRVALGNTILGMYLWQDLGDTIGGANSVDRNIISGCTIYGAYLRACSEVQIQGNYIGTDVTGTQPVGNGNAGVELEDSFAAAGYTTGSSIIGNLISGNGAGVHIGQTFLPGAILNTVQGNFIGTDVSGSKALPNTRFGIEINDSRNTIGGASSGQRNIIAGNLQGGILIYGQTNTTQNLVNNNFIGTDLTGTTSLPNQANGIQIGLNGGFGGSSANTIG